MEIKKTSNGNALVIEVSGRLETLSAPQLDTEIRTLPADVTDLTLDFGKLEYVSSAGLRVILVAQKTMTACGGKMTITGANESVRTVFKITGFESILTFA